jgi:hypothetical protein
MPLWPGQFVNAHVVLRTIQNAVTIPSRRSRSARRTGRPLHGLAAASARHSRKFARENKGTFHVATKVPVHATS